MSANLYLDISKDAFKKYEDGAIEQAVSNLGSDWVDELVYNELNLSDAELEFDDKSGKLFINGSFFRETDYLGYLSLDLPLDLDTVTNIIEFYIKKVNKVKTILEAAK